MFKKKPRPDDRRHDLQAGLQSAEIRLEALRGNAITVASNDPDKLAGLPEPAFHIEFEINALRAALGRVEQESAEAEEKEHQKADRLQREATSRQLHLMADGLEKAIAPVPGTLQALLEAVEVAANFGRTVAFAGHDVNSGIEQRKPR
jgi:hypothetical protein